MIRRLLLLDHPTETRFFLFVGGFGLVLGAIYWILTAEVAGTVMLAGFGLGAGLLGVALFRSRPRAMAIAARRGRAGETRRGERSAPAGARPDAAIAAVTSADRDTADPDLPGPGPLGVDTPFTDESGRMPDETLAPLALGLGVALGLTAVVFGPWLLVAGLVPLAWGAWTWLSGANDELVATVEAERDAEIRARPAPRSR
ncbi:MAG TPA: hypothetical protein VFY23_02770 [Candidatus Limnocylindrales bacterium]|nr:hypothetical protein [Candidatus Limnocylindrales bacterium]